MKRVLLFVLCLTMVFSLCGCGAGKNNTEKKEPAVINVAVLKGPTAIGMVKLMSDAEAGTSVNDYHFTVAGTADEVTASIIKGDIPIAAVPCNLAATLYQKTEGGITVCAVNTLGVLYIVDTGDSVQNVSDLKGKTIYATGAGTTPEYTLRYMLRSAGIDPDNDVNITFLSEASEVVARILAADDEEIIAMLPEPYVTNVTTKAPTLRVALSVSEEWDKLNPSPIVTGVIIANTAWLKENAKAMQDFLKEYAASTSYATSQVDDAATLLEHFDIFSAAIAKKAIPNCNIVCYTGEQMKSAVSVYLQILYDFKPASIGGAMPGDDFYYGK